MDAIIGRYRVHMEENGMLVLRHPTALMFELTSEESLGLLDFLSVYRKSLETIERETDTEIERVVLGEPKEAKPQN